MRHNAELRKQGLKNKVFLKSSPEFCEQSVPVCGGRRTQTRSPPQDSHIAEIDREDAMILIRGQRQAGSRGTRHTVRHPGADQPLQGIFVSTGAGALLCCCAGKSFVLPGSRAGSDCQIRVSFGKVLLSDVLKIPFGCFDEVFQRTLRFRYVAGLRPYAEGMPPATKCILSFSDSSV